MGINVNALALVLSATNLVQVFIIFAQSRRSERKSGAGWWSLAALFAALAFASYEFRNAAPPFSYISVFFNNAFLVLALFSIYTGIRAFFFERNSYTKMVLLVFFALALFALFSTPYAYSYSARRTVLLLAVGHISTPSGYLIFRNREKTDKKWANTMSLSFALVGVSSIIGSVGLLILQKFVGFQEGENTQSAVYFVTLVASIVWTYGFFSILNHRINTNTIRARERFELIFRGGPDAAAIIAFPENIFESVNDAFLKLFDLEIKEILGKKPTEVGLDFSPEIEGEMRKRLENNGICENYQIELKDKRGDDLIILLSVNRVEFENSIHELYVLRDITERQLAEQKIKTAQEQYRLLFENTLEIVLVAQAGRIKLANPAMEKVSGYKLEELIDMPLLKLVYPEDHGELVRDYLERGRKNADSFSDINIKNFRVISKSSEIKWVEMKTIEISWDGKPATLNFIYDVSEREKAIVDMLESESKYRLVAEYASDVIWVFNLSREKLVYISPSVKALRGFTPEEAMNLGYEGTFAPDSLEVARYSLWENFEHFKKSDKKYNRYTTELKQIKKDGETVWVEESVQYRYNAKGEAEAIGVTRNIEERKGASESILYLSYHDQLTGLYNRRHYDEMIDILSDEKFLPLSFLMADVNGLKMTNDAFGHKAGDEILIKAARILKANSRESDHVIRMGGDEFVILLPNTTYEQAQSVRRRISESIQEQEKGTIGLSVSTGIATKKDTKEDFEGLFKRAEDDMYKHKLSESASLRSATINIIMNTLYEKNNREMLHSKRVSELCEVFADKLKMDPNEINQLRLAGLMHDIGKIGIDEKILNSNKTLTKQEREAIERHSDIGYRILSSVGEFSDMAEYILEHHERWDGRGYPRGLAGEEISFQTRIIALADAYDAMTSRRSYSEGFNDEEAAKEIKAHAGSQFDPDLAKVFVEEVLKQNW